MVGGENSWALFREACREGSARPRVDSIPLNIAEGNGKFSAADRGRFLEIARAQIRVCSARLIVARKLARLTK